MGIGALEAPEGVGDFRGMRAERRRPGLAKLLFAAVTPKRADGRDRVPPRGDDIVLAIAPHDAIAGVDPALAKNMGDEVALVLETAVEFGPVCGFEIAIEIEVLQDAGRVDLGLGGAENEARPCPRSAPPAPL